MRPQKLAFLWSVGFGISVVQNADGGFSSADRGVNSVTCSNVNGSNRAIFIDIFAQNGYKIKVLRVLL